MQLAFATEIQARDAALTQVEQAANIAWKVAAHAAVQFLAQTQRSFTADDVTQLVIFPTRENRALGAILMRAKREGLIKHVGYCRSQRPGNHGGPRSVWVGIKEVDNG